jgi:hypothetical protein
MLSLYFSNAMKGGYIKIASVSSQTLHCHHTKPASPKEPIASTVLWHPSLYLFLKSPMQKHNISLTRHQMKERELGRPGVSSLARRGKLRLAMGKNS